MRATAMTGRAAFALTLLRLWAGKVLNAIGVPGVVVPGDVRSLGRPAPIVGPFGEPGPHRVQLDITGGGEKVGAQRL